MFIAKLDHSLSLALFRLTRERSIHTVAVVFARWVFWMLLLGIGFFVYAHQEPLYVAELVKMMTLAIAFGFIGNLWFGKIIVRKRPFITHKLHPLIPTHWLGASFPSDHAMLSFAIATPLSVVDPVIGVWALGGGAHRFVARERWGTLLERCCCWQCGRRRATLLPCFCLICLQSPARLKMDRASAFTVYQRLTYRLKNPRPSKTVSQSLHLDFTGLYRGP